MAPASHRGTFSCTTFRTQVFTANNLVASRRDTYVYIYMYVYMYDIYIYIYIHMIYIYIYVYILRPLGASKEYHQPTSFMGSRPLPSSSYPGRAATCFSRLKP